MRYKTSTTLDPYIGELRGYDRLHLMWVYRTLRRDGVNRWTARMLVHSAFHIGYRVGIASAP